MGEGATEHAEQAAGSRAVPDIELVGLTKRFGDFTAVDSVDLAVASGEFFTMLGPSGSGKTTTLRLIAGFDIPDSGRVELSGEDVASRPPFERDVNTVFQDYALFPHMTVAENVAYGLKVKGVGKSERRERAAAALATVRLPDVGSRRPAQLSGGQRQRVALARAIVGRPRVLLLDEPLGALDLKLREEMQSELLRIQREVGITFIYVTHDQDEALSMSDRIAVFNNGRIEQIGTPREIYGEPATRFVAGFVGTTNMIERDGAALAVRPERIKLLQPGEPTGSMSVEEGVVVDSRYVGQSTRITVDLDLGGSVLVSFQNTDDGKGEGPAGAGERVRLAWRAARLTDQAEQSKTEQGGD